LNRNFGHLSRNTLILLVSNVGSAILSFVLSVLIGRTLGQDGLGVYSTALAWITPLSLVAEFGLGTLITRDVAQNPASETEYLRTTTVARLWLGGGLIVLLVIGAPFLSSDAAVVAGLQISAPLIIILPFFGAFTAIFRARQSMWPIPWLNVGMLVIQVAMTIGVFLGGGGIIAALIVNTITSAGQLAAAWWVYRRKFVANTTLTVGAHGGVPLHITVLLGRAWPFALAAVLAALQTRIGTILLERLTDAGNVGYYAAATRFVEAGRTIPNALFGALFPALAALKQQPKALGRTFRRVMGGLAGFGILLGVICSLFAPLILSLTYGAKFAPAVPVLQIAMWSLLPSLLRGGLTLYWYAVGREQLANVVTGVMVILQAALSLWFIPHYGASGVAMVSVITETAGLALLGWPLLRRGHHEQPTP
jgi:O-antigen/teichoic acid export membrane protein